MDDIEKRPRYFNGQFLDQDDFNLALDYVRERAQRHQRLFHGPGIAGDGLTVTAGVGAQTVTVAPGAAVDALGQQIVLLESSRLSLTNLPNQTALVVISYHEEAVDKATTGTKEERRWLERPTVALVQETGAPPEDTHLRLARLEIEGGKVKVHDPRVRKPSGARMASVETQKLSLSREGIAEAAWPNLTCGGAGLAEVAPDLRVARDLTVRGTLHLNVSGRPASLAGVDGKLGIGTTDPKATVEVNSGNADVSPILAASTPNASDFISIYGARQNGQFNDLLWRRGPLRFGTATSFGGQAFSEKMRITETGNVGIGHSSPMDKLHVAGSARVDGNLNTAALGAASLTVSGRSTLAQEAWKDATYHSGWRHHAPGWNPAGFMIDSMGFVHLRGLVAGTVAGVVIDRDPYSVIFTLPAGYRPPFREVYCVQSADILGRLDITPEGQVYVIRGNTHWLSLDGITFRAASA
jgi:hypothetical protein